MAFKKRTPALVTGRPHNLGVVLQSTTQKIADLPFDLNEIRARHIARRCRLTPIAAGVVADLCFREARR